MSKTVHLKNPYLDVTVRIPEDNIVSQRFDAACVVEQVELNGKHRFCQPEQLDQKRVTTHGIGLSSEFMDPYSEEAKPGEWFPKMGVGLLKQLPEGGRYDKWKTYEVKPFIRTCEVQERAVEFIQEPQSCLGISLRIMRRISIHANQLRVTTTIKNVGERAYEGTEFQHNFFAIDDIPIGTGYRMTVPYDAELNNIMTKGERHAKNDGFRELDEKGIPGELVENPVVVEGDAIVWKGGMEKRTFHKITRSDGVKPQAEYTWTLSCDNSEASVSETHHFVPSNFSMWGVEHTVCNEVHCDIHVEPGESFSFSRTYTFDDETTKNL
jgi:hypothetical protein